MKEMLTNRIPRLRKMRPSAKWDVVNGRYDNFLGVLKKSNFSMLQSLLQVEMRHIVLRDFRHVFQIPCVEAQMGLAFCWPGIGYGL